MAGIGQKKTGGRPKQAQRRKNTRVAQLCLREAILESFTKVGGIDYLVTQSHENPIAYLGLIKAVIPRELELKKVPVDLVNVMADLANRLPV
jgi:hypothetical protein